MFIDDIADVDDEDEEEEVEVGIGLLSSCCARALGVRAGRSVPSSPKKGDRSTLPWERRVDAQQLARQLPWELP